MNQFWRATIWVRVACYVLLWTGGSGLVALLIYWLAPGPSFAFVVFLSPLIMLSLFCGWLALNMWWKENRPVPPGHCRNCSYNLTGNTSGVCPECGTEVGSAPDVPLG